MLFEILRNLSAVVVLEYLMTQGAGKMWLVRFETLPLLLIRLDEPALGVNGPFF